MVWREEWWCMTTVQPAVSNAVLNGAAMPPSCLPWFLRPPPAVVKVLKLLPPAAMRFQLPRTLQRVANLLRGRLQSTR